MVQATLYSDPSCPWAYSESPALRVIEWRYGSQIEWRLVLVGLSESVEPYRARGFTPVRRATRLRHYRRYGMPLAPQPKARLVFSGRACRAVVATRLLAPGAEWEAFRALQLAHFNSPILIDDDDDLREVLSAVPGLDAAAVVASLDDPAVSVAYQRDKEETRRAAGSPAELQGKTAAQDGPVRFTAPSLVLSRDAVELVAGGFQPVEAYDVLVANLSPRLSRRPPPETPLPLLEWFEGGLTSQEVAALLASGNDAPDRDAAERALLELVEAGEVGREPLGDDAIWRAAVK